MDSLKAIKAGRGTTNHYLDIELPSDFGLKAVADMSTANFTGEIPQAYRLPGVNALPFRERSILSLLTIAGTDSPLVSWVYEKNPEGGAAQTAEGALKPLADTNFDVGSQAAKKTAVRMRVTTEMIDDVSYMMSFLQNRMMEMLLEKVEDEVLTGDNTGERLNGFNNIATAFAAPTGTANQIDEANNIDVLKAAQLQAFVSKVRSTRQAIFMHPTDIYLTSSIKVSGSDRRYVDQLYQFANEMRIGAAQVVESLAITQGQFLFAAMDKAVLYQRQAPFIRIGLSGDDFEKNRVTIINEWRGMLVVEHNYRPGIVDGTFSTAKAALEKAGS
jgi:HK97 family phage major capsid protein